MNQNKSFPTYIVVTVMQISNNNKKIGSRSGVTIVTKSDIVVLSHLNFVGGILGNLRIWVSKTLASCKTNIIRVSDGSSEGQNAGRD